MNIRHLMTKLMELPEDRWDQDVIVDVEGVPMELDNVDISNDQIVILS